VDELLPKSCLFETKITRRDLGARSMVSE
jgi:hypothetical protein